MLRSLLVRRVPLALVLFPALVAACGVGGGGSTGFQIKRSQFSVAATAPVVFGGKYLAFLADEATSGAGGTDMNGDGDKIDSIVVMIDTATGVETNLGVAGSAMAWIGSELYFTVSEALDGRDWNGDTDTNDLVLLHVSGTTPAQVPDFIDRVAAAGTTKLIAYGTNLFYTSARVPSGPTDSNVLVISTADPLTPAPVATQDTVGPLSPRILGKDEGMIFFSLDETAELRDLNGDADTTDTNVLALLDGSLAPTAPNLAIHSTKLAMPTSNFPLRARRTTPTSHDWQVGFLVSEAAQGNTNFNCPAGCGLSASWQAPQCVLVPDADTTDWVLHYLSFLAWDADDVLNPPVNTGLVGCRKIAIANGFIATITPESSALDPAGAEGTCDLNQDGDTNDYVVRWVQMTTPVLPVNSETLIHALTDVPGGTHGLAEVGSRFVIEVSESADNLDINGDSLKNLDLLGWLTPPGSLVAPWDFTHGSGNVTFVGASWMGESADRSRLNVALQEKVMGVNINGTPTFPQLPDVDTLDSVPTFANFTGNPVYLAFPGIAIALQTGNSGIVIARNNGFYRVSEAEDNFDWNGDGDKTDFDLRRTTLTQGFSTGMGVLNSLAGRPAIEFNADEASPYAAAFFADEQLQGAGQDLNNDGDTNDLVLSYFHF